MGIFERLVGKTKLQKLEEWRARIEELELSTQENEGRYSNLKGRMANLSATLATAEKQLAEMHAPPARNEIRAGWNQTDRDRQAGLVRGYKADLDALKAEHLDWMQRHEAELQELAQLRDNRPGTGKADTKALADQKREIEAAISRVQSAIAAPDQPPVDIAGDLQTEVDLLSAQQDELAAAVGLGEASADELRKIQTTLAKKQSELEKAKQAQSLAESAQRGYQKRLEKLQTELAETDRLLREAVCAYAGQAYQEAMKRVNQAQHQMDDALQDLFAAQMLDSASGKGECGSTVDIEITAGAYARLPDGIESAPIHFKANEDDTVDRLQKLKAAAGL